MAHGAATGCASETTELTSAKDSPRGVAVGPVAAPADGVGAVVSCLLTLLEVSRLAVKAGENAGSESGALATVNGLTPEITSRSC